MWLRRIPEAVLTIGPPCRLALGIPYWGSVVELAF